MVKGVAMERTETDVDAFLASLEGERGEAMRVLDARIAREFAGLERVLWEGVFWGGTEQRIIGYGAITQPRPRGADVDWFLVGLAAQQQHVSVYVNAVDDGAYLVKTFAPRLGRVKVGSAAVSITRLDAFDLDAFDEMIRRAREVTPDAR
ncbi:hypothetical protein [Agromyces mangrovi Wang et al. 2018]|uniref:hypothetical protein n=1 Tax=Agromyces mangrovi TaxID=1858653 RepID=UPI0025748C6F|nr:hypothetical protein [Agromyces mangrovi]BDZ64252.1 hypothetical protein GCM10025877_11900 [Agromyces mangrovi]